MSEELETQRQLAYIAALRDARLHRSAYFEKLALLNGGTVALVITAILGPMKGQVPHKHLLATALTILIIAMLLLLTRNLVATGYEYHISHQVHDQAVGEMLASGEYLAGASKRIRWTETGGILLTQLGMVLLLTYVWRMLK